MQSFISVTGATFPVLRDGGYLQDSSHYGIAYDNYVVIDSHGIVRYTSVNEPFSSGTGRFSDAHLRSTILGEVTSSESGPGTPFVLRLTSPVRSGGEARLFLGASLPGARATIHDVAGRFVRGLELPGRGGPQWRAVDSRGHPLPAGVYWVRLETSASIPTSHGPLARKLVIVPR